MTDNGVATPSQCLLGKVNTAYRRSDVVVESRWRPQDTSRDRDSDGGWIQRGQDNFLLRLTHNVVRARISALINPSDTIAPVPNDIIQFLIGNDRHQYVSSRSAERKWMDEYLSAIPGDIVDVLSQMKDADDRNRDDPQLSMWGVKARVSLRDTDVQTRFDASLTEAYFGYDGERVLIGDGPSADGGILLDEPVINDSDVSTDALHAYHLSAFADVFTFREIVNDRVKPMIRNAGLVVKSGMNRRIAVEGSDLDHFPFTRRRPRDLIATISKRVLLKKLKAMTDRAVTVDSKPSRPSGSDDWLADLTVFDTGTHLPQHLVDDTARSVSDVLCQMKAADEQVLASGAPGPMWGVSQRGVFTGKAPRRMNEAEASGTKRLKTKGGDVDAESAGGRVKNE